MYMAYQSATQRDQSKIMRFISDKSRERKEKWDKIWGFTAILLWLSFMAGMVCLLLWDQEFFIAFRNDNFLGRTIDRAFQEDEVIPRYRIFFILMTFIYPICACFCKGIVENKKALVIVGVVILVGIVTIVLLDFAQVVNTYYAGNASDYFTAVFQVELFKVGDVIKATKAFLAMEGMPEAVKMNFYSIANSGIFLLSIPSIISYQLEYKKRVKIFGKKLRISSLYCSMALGAFLGVAFRNAIGFGVSTTGSLTKLIKMASEAINSKKYEKKAKKYSNMPFDMYDE